MHQALFGADREGMCTRRGHSRFRRHASVSDALPTRRRCQLPLLRKVAGRTNTFENGQVGAESRDERRRKGRAGSVEEGCGVEIGRHDQRLVDLLRGDGCAERRSEKGCGVSRFDVGVEEADAAVSGGRPVRVAVDGDARGICSAVLHFAQHPGEEFPEAGVEIGVAQVQPDDSAHDMDLSLVGG
ncbi:Uncharacterised protein [Mycobacteroides abscessus subsp. abscessus]|nr:Uncharacterised protein [Mycobacteroides abscessus subsp. abscessus]